MASRVRVSNSSAPGFQIELDSLDPKTFARFPRLNGSFRHELDKLRKLLEEETES